MTVGTSRKTVSSATRRCAASTSDRTMATRATRLEGPLSDLRSGARGRLESPLNGALRLGRRVWFAARFAYPHRDDHASTLRRSTQFGLRPKTTTPKLWNGASGSKRTSYVEPMPWRVGRKWKRSLRKVPDTDLCSVRRSLCWSMKSRSHQGAPRSELSNQQFETHAWLLARANYQCANVDRACTCGVQLRSVPPVGTTR